VKLRAEQRVVLDDGDEALPVLAPADVVRPADWGDVVGRGEYGERFVSIVERDTLFGAQFHPEKSSRDGLALLGNFARVAARVAA